MTEGEAPITPIINQNGMNTVWLLTLELTPIDDYCQSIFFSQYSYMDNLCYIKTKNSLKKREKHSKIKQAIKEKVLSIHQHYELRKNEMIEPELILMVCNCVENCIKKGAGVDKKSFVIEILEDIFTSLSPNEREHIGNQCQFYFDNALIEIILVTTKILSIGWNYIKSKL